MKTYSPLLTTLLLFGLSACSSVDSRDIKTSGFYVIYSVTGIENNQTKVQAIMSTSSSLTSDYIDLKGGDTVITSVAGTSKTLTRESKGVYANTFPSNASQQFKVALNRPNDPDAPNSSVTLPAPFSLSSPTPNQAFASGAAISLQWSPAIASSNFDVIYDTTCTDTIGESIRDFGTLSRSDTGTLTIQPANLIPAGIDTTKTCLCSLTLSRNSTGSIDSALKGGSIRAHQLRTVSILINP